MNNKIKLIIAIISVSFSLFSCKKAEYSLGSIAAPSNLSMTVNVAGYNSVDTGGNGSGSVTIHVASKNALQYRVDFGDSSTFSLQTFTSDSLVYKYHSNGTFDYTISLIAIGTGGATSSLSQKVHINVVYQLDSSIVEKLTSNSSKTWVIDKSSTGHVGVGPVTTFTPDYYAATPNSRSDCLYDDEVTFQLGTGNNIYMTLDNKGQSFIINAATAFYGQGTNAGDNCYTIDPGGKKLLGFSDATSASTADISTRKQFSVSGYGLVAFGTGGTTYEILSLTDATMQLRNIGADGLAWYQKLKIK